MFDGKTTYSYIILCPPQFKKKQKFNFSGGVDGNLGKVAYGQPKALSKKRNSCNFFRVQPRGS